MSKTGKLKDWADQQTNYIKLADGESIAGQYVGFQMIANKFDPKKESVRYILLVEGEEKYFESGSAAVARQFDGLSENERIQITRKGEGNETKYTIKSVGAPAPEVQKPDPKELG